MSPTAARSPLSTTGALLADATHLGAVELTVTSLDRAIAFYQDAIGLRLQRREDPVAAMGAGGEELVVLHEEPGARPPARHAGLYHFALLFPTREELARAVLRVAQARVPIDGASDHGTHEALYLHDPDGNGIELAADFPRERWPDLSGPGGYGAGPAPLDVDDLLATVAGEPPAPRAAEGLRMGHVHLHVGDLEAATRFYRDGLGFEVVTDLGTAVFVAAGGYHHHVGFNVWRGRGVGPAPADAVGLRHWTLHVAGEDELDAVRARLSELGVATEERAGGVLARDPSGIAVLVSAGRSAA
jgi:catechol 2,3-dioxygenase